MRVANDLYESCKALLHSNSFWVVVVWLLYDATTRVSPNFIATHPWFPFAAGAIAVLFKVTQNYRHNHYMDSK